MGTYAKDTTVDTSRSRDEIERTLVRYGADQFMYGWRDGQALVEFKMKNRRIRFLLTLPGCDEFKLTEAKRIVRSEKAQSEAYDQACRQRWRALLLVIKAKLESQESGIETFEEAFAMQTVLPDGSTAAEYFLPQVAMAYKTNVMPPMLPMLGDEKN